MKNEVILMQLISNLHVSLAFFRPEVILLHDVIIELALLRDFVVVHPDVLVEHVAGPVLHQ